MALSYQVKIRAKNAENQQRTLTFSPLSSEIDSTDNLNNFAQKLQPLLTETITSAEAYRIRTVDNYASTVDAGTDGIPNSTQDSTIYELTNSVGSKRITISRSASAAESDTSAFTAYATAVYDFGHQLTTYYIGDYSIEDVTLRAIFDTEIEDPT